MTPVQLLEKLAVECPSAFLRRLYTDSFTSADYHFATAMEGVTIKAWVFDKGEASTITMLWEGEADTRTLKALFGADVSTARWPALENELDMGVAEQLLRSVLK